MSSLADTEVEEKKLELEQPETDDNKTKEISTLVKFIGPLPTSPMGEELVFIREHPIQPLNVKNFNANRVYNQQLPNGNVSK